MANKPKIGLEYFPLETDFFQDIKIRKLIRYQSGEALSIYLNLLCIIYKNGYYIRWESELPFVISEATGSKEGYIAEVVKCCLTIGLFSEKMFNKNKVLTSKGIQERYQVICSQAKRKCIISEFMVESSEELSNNSEELIINSEEMPQSKVKESKVKESKVNIAQAPIVFDFKKAMIGYGFEKGIVEQWLIVRKNKKATNSEIAFNDFIREFEKKPFADKNETLRQVVAKSWSGFSWKWLAETEEVKKPGKIDSAIQTNLEAKAILSEKYKDE